MIAILSFYYDRVEQVFLTENIDDYLHRAYVTTIGEPDYQIGYQGQNMGFRRAPLLDLSASSCSLIRAQ